MESVVNILFHSSTLCHRGTTTAILDYAKYNQELLGNTSLICYPKNFSDSGVSPDSLTQQEVIDKIRESFTVIGYEFADELINICSDNNISHFYNIKAGFNDGLLIPNVKNIVHAVFNTYDPHGDKYAYVSSWLANIASNNTYGYVPHIVSLPERQNIDWRKKLNISDDKIVIGRYGGLYQFDLRPIMQTVYDFAMANDKYVFLFVNTAKFCTLPNVIFLPPIIEKQDKTDFITSCDAMIHARSDGETFGLAICEGLFHNKPVFCFNGGRDRNHIELLSDTGLLYSNEQELIKQLINVDTFMDRSYRHLVEEFSPEQVMKKFKTEFLD